MESYDNTDRLDDLIDQIDQTNVNKKRRGVLLSLIVLTILAFTTYLSFAQNNDQQHPAANNMIKETDSGAKARIISSSIPLENFNDRTHEIAKNNNVPNASKTPAVFLGDPKGVTQYLKDHILYPGDAFENKVEGKVLVQITINENGVVKNPTIIKGLGYGCDEEVVRVVSEMPDWQPAKINQEPVKKSYILTVTFSLS